MKKYLALLLALTMLLALAACAGGEQPSDPTESAPRSTEEEPSQQDASPETPETPTGGETPAEGEAAPVETGEIAPEETEVALYHNQDAYDGPCLFQPERDGVYRFYSTNPSYEMEMYDPAAITWSVYVLDEPFEDAWRFLPQAYRPAISDFTGEMTLELKAGAYVYCLCSWTSFHGDPAEDNAATLTIYATDREYGPTASNGYVQPVSIGAEANVDLDGDGTADNIYYAVREAEEQPDGSWTEDLPVSLQINDREFLGDDAYNPFQPFDIWLENCDAERYYIVDLDASDGLKELAIRDFGNNDWRMTHLFRYEEGMLTYLDTITGFPEDEDTTYHGDGSVSAYTRFDVMQTWGGVVTYKLNNGKMERVAGELVQPMSYGERTVTLKQPLTVYREMDRSSEQLTLQPSDQPLTFPLTDTEHWVQIVCADGSSGWAYFEDFAQVENNGSIVDDNEIFDNLLFAG